MINKISFLAATAVCLAGIVALQGCKSEERSGEALPVDALAYEVTEAKAPKGYKIYLDASVSMLGYFEDGLRDYISIVANIENVGDSASVYFWGDSVRPEKDLNSTLSKNYSGTESLFWDIFSCMAKEVREDSVMTFLVTDGVVSNCGATTKQRISYTIDDLPLVEGKVKESLGEGLAVGVFRFKVPFSGTYYDIDNKKVSLLKTERPLYVFAISTPGALADFKENRMSRKEMESFNAKLEKSIWLGLLEEKKNDPAYKFQDANSSFEADSTEERTIKVILPAGTDTDDLSLTVELPGWMEEYGIDIENLGTLELKSNDKDLSKELETRYVAGKVEIFPGKSNSDRESDDDSINAIDLCDNFTLSYSIVYRPSTEWNQYSSEDDRNISIDTDEQNKTFGLKEMIKGFELATKHPDTIFRTSLKFERE